MPPVLDLRVSISQPTSPISATAGVAPNRKVLLARRRVCCLPKFSFFSGKLSWISGSETKLVLSDQISIFKELFSRACANVRCFFSWLSTEIFKCYTPPKSRYENNKNWDERKELFQLALFPFIALSYWNNFVATKNKPNLCPIFLKITPIDSLNLNDSRKSVTFRHMQIILGFF